MIILKVDIYPESSLIPIVIYDIYNPNTKEKLNLEYCKYLKNDIIFTVKINENELFKYNQSDKFYSDICSTYTTEKGTDIIIKDRQNEFINKNMTLCEQDCKYTNYDKNKKKVNCKCFVKISIPFISNLKFNIEKLKNNFMEIKELININVIKCYKKVFTKEGLIENIGSYIILLIILFYIIATIIFYISGFNNLSDKIKKIEDYKIKNIKGKIPKIIKINSNLKNIQENKQNCNIKKKRLLSKKR